MASIKIKFRPSNTEGQEGSIYYQVLHDRVPRQLATTYKILPEEWDSKRGNINYLMESPRKAHLIAIRERIKLDVERLTRIIRLLEDSGIAYTGDDICEEFRSYSDRLSLDNYMEKAITRLKEGGKRSTSTNYRSALRSFKHFLSSRGEDDVMLDSITPQLIEDYQTYLQGRGIVRNTISFYMRQLRAVYNTAVYEGLLEQRNPFRKVYTGIDKTVKRAISLDALTQIVHLDLSESPKLDYARDMFVLSFFLRGISFVDMAYLKKDSIKNGYLIYCRRKTGQRLKIKWTEDMQEILDKYPANTSDYLLPVIKTAGVDEHTTYKYMLSEVNKGLKKIGDMAKLPVKLTHYAARHTWASVAQAKRVPIDLISEGMGHDSVKTTKIYLASLDTSGIDKVNDKMIKSIKKK